MSQEAGARTYLLLGGLGLVAGAAVVLAATGVIPSPPETMKAPPWVVGLSGGVFALVGVYMLAVGIRARSDPEYVRRLSESGEFRVGGWAVGTTVLIAFTAIAAWVAFGDGPREFSGSVGVGGIGVSGRPDASTGRLVFGISAGLCGLTAVWFLVYGVRRWFSRTPRPGA